MLDNPILKSLADKALRKYFKENKATLVTIEQDEKGSFVFGFHSDKMKVVKESDLNNLLKLIQDGNS